MKKISRRSFLMATGVIAASAALSACGGPSPRTPSLLPPPPPAPLLPVLPLLPLPLLVLLHRAAATS